MTIATPMLALDGAPHTLVASEPDGLAAIGRSDVNLCVWRRARPAGLARLLDPLPADALPHVRLESVPLSEVSDALAVALGPRLSALRLVVEDVAALARRIAAIASAARLRVRLERVQDNACRRFHADQVRLRLLCTYRGPGTEWLPDATPRRDGDGGIAEPPSAAIRRLARFEVALLKGAAHPSGRPLIHRSPPIAGTGIARLLLAIDPLDDQG